MEAKAMKVKMVVAFTSFMLYNALVVLLSKGVL